METKQPAWLTFINVLFPMALISSASFPKALQIVVSIEISLLVCVVMPYYIIRMRKFKKAGLIDPNLVFIKNNPKLYIAYTAFALLAIGYILIDSHYFARQRGNALYEKYKQRLTVIENNKSK